MTLPEALGLPGVPLEAAGILDPPRDTSVAVEDTEGWTVCPRGCSREPAEVRDGPAASKAIASVPGFQFASANIRGDVEGSLPVLREDVRLPRLP